jgi:hypothetical protein
MDMIVELAVATVMVLVTVALHAAALLGLGVLVSQVERAEPRSLRSPLSKREGATLMIVVLGLFVAHGIQIWLYAAVFHALGAISDLREAVYFSTISYAAIGYADTAISERWKLLGAIEGINGVLLLGWTVAFFATVMARFAPASRNPNHRH